MKPKIRIYTFNSVPLVLLSENKSDAALLIMANISYKKYYKILQIEYSNYTAHLVDVKITVEKLQNLKSYTLSNGWKIIQKK